MKSLRNLFGLIVLFSCGLTGCDLDGSNWSQSDLVLNIEAWTLKDTSKVNTPFTLDLASSVDNSCVSNFQFNVTRASRYQYFVWAKARYESHGEQCLSINVVKDTIISIVPDTVGKYFFYLRNGEAYNVDSIVIVP